MRSVMPSDRVQTRLSTSQRSVMSVCLPSLSRPREISLRADAGTTEVLGTVAQGDGDLLQSSRPSSDLASPSGETDDEAPTHPHSFPKRATKQDDASNLHSGFTSAPSTHPRRNRRRDDWRAQDTEEHDRTDEPFEVREVVTVAPAPPPVTLNVTHPLLPVSVVQRSWRKPNRVGRPVASAVTTGGAHRTLTDGPRKTKACEDTTPSSAAEPTHSGRFPKAPSHATRCDTVSPATVIAVASEAPGVAACHSPNSVLREPLPPPLDTSVTSANPRARLTTGGRQGAETVCVPLPQRYRCSSGQRTHGHETIPSPTMPTLTEEPVRTPTQFHSQRQLSSGQDALAELLNSSWRHRAPSQFSAGESLPDVSTSSPRGGIVAIGGSQRHNARLSTSGHLSLASDATFVDHGESCLFSSMRTIGSASNKAAMAAALGGYQFGESGGTAGTPLRVNTDISAPLSFHGHARGSPEAPAPRRALQLASPGESPTSTPLTRLRGSRDTITTDRLRAPSTTYLATSIPTPAPVRTFRRRSGTNDIAASTATVPGVPTKLVSTPPGKSAERSPVSCQTGGGGESASTTVPSMSHTAERPAVRQELKQYQDAVKYAKKRDCGLSVKELLAKGVSGVDDGDEDDEDDSGGK